MRRNAVMVIAALAALSCSRTDAPSADAVVRGGVTFACAPATKSPSSAEVSSLDLLVFRRDGGAVDCRARSEVDTVRGEVAVGVPLVYHVAANVPEGSFSGVSTEEAFLASVWRLSDIGSAPAMAGGGSGTFGAAAGAVEVGVTRLCSRVTLRGLTPKFLRGSFTQSEVRLERVFLINVNGTCPYSAVPADGGVWHNRQALDADLPAGLRGCLVREKGRVLTGSSRIADTSTFLCCPNPVDNGLTGEGWSPRNTRLVIELSIDGRPNYYPVTLPAMACNTDYVITDAVLAGPGSDDPDTPPERTAVTFTVSVLPWGDVEDIDLPFD